MSAELHAKLEVETAGGFTLDVEFDAPPGVTVLFGPSGSGKSTTLAAIAGLVRPTRGRIALGNEVWFDSSAKAHVAVHRRRIAFVFQTLALFPHMSALGNVVYGMNATLDVATRDQRAMALLERFRVAHLIRRKPGTFSGGEAQRVALARAWASHPRLILFDEPFSAMDREIREELIADLRDSIRELEVPALLVTHDREEARALGEHLVVLEEGRVQRRGKVDDLGSQESTRPRT